MLSLAGRTSTALRVFAANNEGRASSGARCGNVNAKGENALPEASLFHMRLTASLCATSV